MEKVRDGHSTSLGAASGIVAGLVAITPGAVAMTPTWAMVLSFIAGTLCAAVGLKCWWGYDDSLDVVGVHLAGGLLGTLFIGLAADPESPAGQAGLLYGGGLELLGKQALGAGAVLVYSFTVAYALAWLIQRSIGFRISPDHEHDGIDERVHAEYAYDLEPTRSHLTTPPPPRS